MIFAGDRTVGAEAKTTRAQGVGGENEGLLGKPTPLDVHYGRSEYAFLGLRLLERICFVSSKV